MSSLVDYNSLQRWSTPCVKFIFPTHDTRLYRYLSGLGRLQKIRQGLVVALAKCPAKIPQPQPRKMPVMSNFGAAQLKHRIPRFLLEKSEP